MFLLFAILFSSSASAASSSFDHAGFHITVEPIVGYEFTQVNAPVIHTRGMLIYGARVTAGHKLLSGEGEFTLGTTNESFPTQDQNIKTDKQNARLGVRSTFGAIPMIDFLVRLGGQASQTKVSTTTISTASTVTVNPSWEIHPYAGTGLQVHLLNAFSLSVEATYLFKSVSDWSQNDVQTSVSCKINLPH
jgi:hypothetical protein